MATAAAFAALPRDKDFYSSSGGVANDDASTLFRSGASTSPKAAPTSIAGQYLEDLNRSTSAEQAKRVSFAAVEDGGPSGSGDDFLGAASRGANADDFLSFLGK